MPVAFPEAGEILLELFPSEAEKAPAGPAADLAS
jgi:hypothetical protein